MYLSLLDNALHKIMYLKYYIIELLYDELIDQLDKSAVVKYKLES